MSPTDAIDLLESGRVARLATIRPDGSPHIVPIAYATAGESIVTMIDHKPKRTPELQRLRNIEENPSVSLLVDHWSDTWEELWWVRVDGTASIHRDDDMWREARMMLVTKYSQYRQHPPEGPAIVIAVGRVTSWSYSG